MDHERTPTVVTPDGATSEATAAQLEIVRAINAPLPGFYKEDPKTWFIQTEAIFAAHKISSQYNRFQRIIGHLPREIIIQVTDLVTNPGEHPYEALKQRLIEIYAPTKQQQMQRLLEDMQLGDQKPSQLLRIMRHQAGTDTSDEILRFLWLRKLPKQTQSLLAAWEDEKLDKMARIADRSIEYCSEIVTEVKQDTQSQWQSHIEALSDRVKTLEGRERNKQQTHWQQKYIRYSNICWYHRQWGSSAQKCTPPCQYSKNRQQGNATAQQVWRDGL